VKTILNTHDRRTFLIWSAMTRAARLTVFGFIGGTLLFLSEDLACKAVVLGAVIGLAVLASVTFYVSRSRARDRADRRWRAAVDHYAQKELDRYLDRYAEQQRAKRIHSGGHPT
jgi:O-antigen/teichoic acid export membrane protein